MRKKLVVALLPLLAAGYFTFKALGPEPPQSANKVDGDVYVLGKDFLINLRGTSFARLSVALVLEHGEGEEAEPEEPAAKPPEGYGPLPQEAVVRSIVTGELTGQSARRLANSSSRAALKRLILRQLDRLTDVHAKDVLFMDVTVQ